MFRLLLAILLVTPSFTQTAASYRQQAIRLSQKKSWDEAIANYRKALALEPNDASTHYNLALTLKIQR
jgi:tetratricopeptide (TPR) repeat protein